MSIVRIVEHVIILLANANVTKDPMARHVIELLILDENSNANTFSSINMLDTTIPKQ